MNFESFDAKVRPQCNVFDTALMILTVVTHQMCPLAELGVNPAFRPMDVNTSNRIAESMPKAEQERALLALPISAFND